MSGELAGFRAPKNQTKPHRIPRNPEKAFDLGHKIGAQVSKDAVRQEVLTWLQAKYREPNIERGSVEGEAILTVARELAEFIKGL